ncbi:MAG: hypothetical protein DRQ35_01260 [Gammaproteobacteria bacterium]|nr:MAG: hypothetical protein DRQ35_01260 [Gammaproteobacteria bacterium]
MSISTDKYSVRVNGANDYCVTIDNGCDYDIEVGRYTHWQFIDAKSAANFIKECILSSIELGEALQ